MASEEGAAKRGRGRPSIMTAEIADRICERLAQGEPLTKICEDPDMPAFRTVFRWEGEQPEFGQLSARARIIGTHYMASDCIRIADDPNLEPADKRVRIDTRIRLIGKWNSKEYGDRQQMTLSDPNGGPVRVNLTNLTNEQLAQLEALMGAAGAIPAQDGE